MTPAQKEKAQKLIETKFSEVLNFCTLVLSDYESASLKQSKLALYVNLSGLVAGSVIAPALIAANAAANATTSAIFAGWAGATNLAGKSIEEYGLSGGSSAATRNKIVDNVTRQIEVITNSDNNEFMRRDALLRMRAACVVHVINNHAPAGE